MRKFNFFLLFSTLAFSQQSDNLHKDLETYETQCKRSRKTARILATTGGIMSATGIIIAVSDSNRGIISSQQTAGLIVAAMGAAVTISSLPFWAKAAKKRDKHLQLQPVTKLENLNERKYLVSGIQVKF